MDFSRNVALWSEQFPLAEVLVESVDCSPLTFCQTDEGELNLFNGKQTYHDPKGAKKEALKWFSELNLEGVSLLFVYGIGLGYLYEPLRDWLASDETRHLIFFEDDPRVVVRFLQTDLAEEILRHPRVELSYLTSVHEYGSPFANFTAKYMLQTSILSALPLYLETKGANLPLLDAKIKYYQAIGDISSVEHLSFGACFFQNFYRNCLDLPNAFLGNELRDKFQGIPCIVCGAGPSLEKNFAVLETLNDKALILAGGTAFNALNGTKVRPHFGQIADPFPFQLTRLMMNQAFETPYFYINRVYRGALQLVTGPKLYLSGTTKNRVAEWFEEKLGIAYNEEDMGSSVTSANIALAKWLGCSPIILVGVDLGYSENASYSKRVGTHALHDWKKDFSTKVPDEELLLRKDINGELIHTLWKWVHESMWISNFSKDLNVINATEGGIGFGGIPNIALKEVAEKELTKTYDLEGLVHKEIQTHPMPSSVTRERIFQLIETLKESLIENGELAHKKVLEEFEEAFLKVHRSNENLDVFLAKGRESNLFYIKKALAEAKEPESVTAPSPAYIDIEGESEFYSDDGELLAKSNIVDGVKQGRAHLFYSGGNLYAALNYLDGFLDGEQRYFYPTGVPKSVLSYSKGLLDGRIILFHPNGKVWRQIHFSKGQWHGKEEWWDEKGQKIIEAEYCHSEPINIAREWYPNGQLKMEKEKKITRRFLPTGEELPEEIREDYFESVTRETDQLTQSLKTVVEKLQSTAELTEGNKVDELLSEIAKEMEELDRLHKEMEKEVGSEIFKTPSAKKVVDEALKEISQEMSDSIETMQDKLSASLKKLGRKKK